jgi:hypothetical protein
MLGARLPPTLRRLAFDPPLLLLARISLTSESSPSPHPLTTSRVMRSATGQSLGRDSSSRQPYHPSGESTELSSITTQRSTQRELPAQPSPSSKTEELLGISSDGEDDADEE